MWDMENILTQESSKTRKQQIMCKKLLVLLISLVSLTTLNSQEYNIKIEEFSIEGFSDLIERSKAKQLSEQVFISTFESYENSLIVQTEQENGNKLLGVIFPEGNTWDQLKNNYDIISKKLDSLYGEPLNVINTFDLNNDTLSNEDKLNFITSNNPAFLKIHKIENLLLSLSITYTPNQTFHVNLNITHIPQTESVSPMIFKGIPMGGDVNEFVEKLKNDGLEFIRKQNGFHVLKGSFAGYDNCNLYIVSSKKDGIVYSASVNFPHFETWDLIFGNYSNIKSALIRKYGEPHSCIEEFKGPSTDNNKKLLSAKKGLCNYETSFRTDSGTISLKINNINTDTANVLYVSILYIDKNTAMEDHKDSMNDL